MSYTWYENDCFQCGEPNLVCNGDESDWTQEDVADGFKCWKCGACNMLNDDGEMVRSDRDEDEHEDGLPHPQRSAIELAAPDMLAALEGLFAAPALNSEKAEHAAWDAAYQAMKKARST